jgi:signal transduction histidine kinase
VTDRSRVVIGRSMAALAISSSILGLAWLLALGYGHAWDEWLVHNAIVGVGAGLIVWLVIETQPENGAIWVHAWAGLFTGMEVLTAALAYDWARSLGIESSLLQLVPADLPTGLALVLMQMNWLWMGVLLMLLVLALFPDGKPPSARWRWLPATMISVVGLTMLGLFWGAKPSFSFPLVQAQDTNGGFSSPAATLVTLGYPLTFVIGLMCMAALLVRFRRSVGEERQQFRWVAWGASAMAILMVIALMLDEFGDRVDISLYLGAVGLVVLIGSIGVAIGRYRLYDIDVVISRTLVYGALALFIGLVYVGIVVGVGFLLGVRDEPNRWLDIVATVLIAIAFQPLRRRLQRMANRLVYGRRATPYEVLSSFSQGVSTVDPDVLSSIARSLAEGTTAQSASIWINRGGSLQCIASWPEEVEGLSTGSDVFEGVVHDGEDLGRVVLGVPPGQPFPIIDERLLKQVAAGLGLALRNLLLTEDLKARVDELAASRRRIVTVQDETRRKLERDLHDGAQQRLVALKIKLGIGSSMAEEAGLEAVQSLLDTVRRETDQTIESVRDFARGIYPPLLEAEGLGAALAARARNMPIPVTVQAAGLSRYPKDQEATVYFCILEALQNTMKHAGAASVHVVIAEQDGDLVFNVRDDGIGFDETAAMGNGLTNMSDRLDAGEGSLEVISSPGHGTELIGRLPATSLVVG